MRRKGLREIIIERQYEAIHWIKNVAEVKKDCGIKGIEEIESFIFLNGYATFLAEQIKKSRKLGSEEGVQLMADLKEKSSYLAGLKEGNYTHRSLNKAINAFQASHQKVYDFYFHGK